MQENHGCFLKCIFFCKFLNGPDPKQNWAGTDPKKNKLPYIGLESAQPRGLG